MRGEDCGEGVVKVGIRVLGVTELAVCYYIWTVLKIEQPGVQRDDFCAEGIVCRCKAARSQEGQTVEERIDVYLNARGRQGEDVLWREGRQRSQDEGTGHHKENEEGARHGGRNRPNCNTVDTRCCSD